MRLIDADDLTMQMIANFQQAVWGGADSDECQLALDTIGEAPTVDAVVLPHQPRPLLKDRNPFNMDVYCPECGTNLSGYYGEDSLPIITCFNCGEILDAHKTTTKTDGERRSNG